MLWILCLATIALMSDNSFADPRQWDTDGVAVREANFLRWWGETASADDGASMLVWTLEKRRTPELYGQWLSSDGSEVSDFNGRLLARGGDAGISYPEVIFVGDGYIVTWMDLDILNEDEVYVIRGRVKAMKYSAGGTRMWAAPALDGVLIHDGGTADYRPELAMCDDGNGGAYIHWYSAGHWYLQRVTSAGALAWAAPLELPEATNWSLYSIAADGAGGAFAAWQAAPDVFCQRYDATGTSVWPSPALLGDAEAPYANFNVYGDGTGGALISWDVSGPNGRTTNAQRLNVDGQLMWQEGGVQIAGPHYGYSRVALSFAQGTIDGLLVGWQSRSEPYFDRVFVQKVNLTSELLWGTNEMCPSSEQFLYQEVGRIASDQAGGALVIWNEDWVNSPSFRLSHVNASGSSVWNDCFMEYSSGRYTSSARVLLGGGNRAIVVWENAPEQSDHLRVKSFDLINGALASTLLLDDYLFGDVGNYATLSLPNARIALVWEDTRGDFSKSLYYKILEADGSSEFPESGAELVIPAGDELAIEDLSLCSDGAGGFFCVFASFEGGNRILRLTRRAADGTQIGPASGQLIGSPIYDQRYAHCISDQSNGAYVVWSEFDDNFYLDIFAQRVNSQCQTMWSEPTTVLNETFYDEIVVGLVPSTNGSCIAFGRTDDFAAYHVEALRLTSEGTIDWQTAATPDSIDFSDVISDGHGGAVLTWRAGYYAQGDWPRVQRLDANGSLLWPTEGVRLDTVSYYSSYPKLGIDQADNVFATYFGESESGLRNIRVQKISPNGDLLWTENARVFEMNFSNVGWPKIAVVNSENIYVCWSEQDPSYTTNLLAVHLNGNGESAPDPFWHDQSGSELIESPMRTLDYQLVADVDEGIAVAWSEFSSTGFAISLAAQRIYDPIPVSVEDEPVVPTEFSLAQNYPNPFNPSTVIEFSLPTTSKASLKVFDVTGRLVATLVDETMIAGVHRVSFDAASLPSGVYFYNFRADHHSMTRKMVLLR